MVYRAQDLLLNRPVALKILYPELSADPLFVERFRREAQAAAKLSHPNIVPVFDWGEDEGTYFIVMELVEGRSLADVLRGGSVLTASRTAQLAAQVAAALNYAHRNGMVHRDVKPGNILITADAQVKVTDFGIAQAVSSEDHLAEDGLVMGTATYFSPEQAEGAAVDGRSDVYALGVVMYEMLVGRPPFIGDTPLEVSTQHVHGTVTPPTEINASVPRDLEAIVMKALSKNPDLRYPTADELRADLLRFVDGQPVHAAGAVGAFFGNDSTQMVQTVTPGERTAAVPILRGPRVDVKRRRRRPSTGLVFVIVIVLLAAAAAGYYSLSSKKSLSVMPSFAGQDAIAATAQLVNDGINANNISTTQINSSVTVGKIVRTDPVAGGPVTSSTKIVLYTSKGKAIVPVQVPTVTNMSVIAASAILNGKGLVPSVQNVTSACSVTPAPNIVLCQSPLAGVTANPGSSVILYVLPATGAFPLANLSQDTVSQASVALGGEGLKVSAAQPTVCSNTIAQGIVVKTFPVAGTQVASGDSIQLVTSSGPCKNAVYAVVGRLVSTASTLLSGQGFIVAEEVAPASSCTSPSSLDKVVSQTPGGGQPALYGSTVTIQYCNTSGASGATGTTGTTGATGTTGLAGGTTTTSTTTTSPVTTTTAAG